MIASSEQFNTVVGKSSRTFKARFLYNEAEIPCDIKKITITRGACGSETFSPGTAFSSYIEATIDEPEDTLENRELLLQIGLALDDGTEEYINLGYYTVTKPKSTAYQTVFTAVGRITSKLNFLFETEDMSLAGIIAAITSITGVPIILNGLTATGTIRQDMTGLTCKEALEVIAAVLGGFATEDNNGNIVISKFSTADPISYNGERMTELPSFNDYDYSVTGVKVIVTEAGEDEDGNEISELAYTEGTPRLIIVNSYMTESLFTGFAGNLIGYTYRPGTVPLALGDPRLDPWDCLSVTDVKGNIYTVPCLNIVHTFDGGLSTMIAAPGDSETEEDAKTAGPITKQLERINTVLLTAQEAIIKRLKVTEAELTYAKVTDLDAVNAAIEGLIVGELTAGSMKVITGYVDDLTATKADIDFANVDTAKIGQAWINDLLVQGSILTSDINAATGSFSQYLTGVNIVGDIITAGTISTDRLVIRDPETNKGILFAINDGIVSQEALTEETLKRLTLNGQVITAESITADKINVTDLFAQDIEATGSITGAKLYGTYLESISGKIGGFAIGQSALYNGTSSLESENYGVYVGTDGFKNVGSEGSVMIRDGYVDIVNVYGPRTFLNGQSILLHEFEDSTGIYQANIDIYRNDEAEFSIYNGGIISHKNNAYVDFGEVTTGTVTIGNNVAIDNDITVYGDAEIQGSLNLFSPLSISGGGTGSTSATGARRNLGFRSGRAEITPSAANTPTTKAITWTAISSTPTVVATPNTGVAGTTVLGVGASYCTTTGCTLQVTRTNTITTTIMYIAIG